MIQHVDDGKFQALLDRELTTEEERYSREHLASCPDCRASFEELREANLAFSGALRVLDPVTVVTSVDPATAARRVTISAPPSTRATGRSWRYAGFAKAAALLFTVAAAASATIPGSPLREWFANRGANAVVATAPMAEQGGAPEATTMAAQAPVESGVSVEPLDGALRIVVSRAAPAVRIRARLVESPRGGVFASGPAADASFSTAPGTIEVIGVSSGELRVEIPRSAASASIVIDGRTYLEKDGDALRVSAELRDSANAEVVFDVQP